MRQQRSRNGGRTAGQEEYDFTLQVEAGEIVVLRLRDLEPVTGKHHRRLDVRRRIDAHAERGFVSEHNRDHVRSAHQREARLRFVDRAGPERHRLKIAVRPARLQAGLFEMAGDVLGRLAMFGAARLAAFHAVISQEADVPPPARGWTLRGHCGSTGQEQQRRDRADAGHRTSERAEYTPRRRRNDVSRRRRPNSVRHESRKPEGADGRVQARHGAARVSRRESRQRAFAAARTR